MAEQEMELMEQVDDFLKRDLKRVDGIKDDDKRKQNLEVFEKLYKTHMQAQAEAIKVNNDIYRRESEEQLEKMKLEHQIEIDKKNSQLKIFEIIAKVMCGAATLGVGVAYGRSHTNKILRFSETGTLGNIESNLLKEQTPRVPGVTITHF